MSRPAAKTIESPVFAPGSRVVVRDEEWIVRTSAASATGGTAVRCTGLSELVANKEAIFLTELDQVVELRPEETKLVCDPSAHFRKSRLYLESLLRQTPPTDEQLYIGHRGAMDLANYQLVPTAQALAQPRPRILIADAVGLGKTVEVGVLLSELIRRGRGRRILVVALKSILAQFQEELWARFTIPLVRLDSIGIQRVQSRIPSNMNPFYYFDRVIISIDTLKKDEKYRRFLSDCHWDAIVIDECQHVADRARISSSQLSQRARLAKLLARTCDAMILTSATPHDGRPESFASLMNLLEPTAIADPSTYTADEIEGLYVRRFKKDVVHEVEQAFAPRELTAQRLDASEAENQVFAELARATFKTVRPRRRADAPSNAKGVLFATLLLKALLSSPAALASTLTESLANKRLGDDKLADPDVAHDRAQLQRLQTLAAAVTPEHFSKLQHLLSHLRELGLHKTEADDRIVVFSERLQTLELLKQQIQSELGLSKEQVVVFDGSLDDIKQKNLVKDFQSASSKVRVLLASDAAAEGINLHFFCHRLIHFDLPWSLITLEQRNGRIDRFGQTHAPQITYLLTIPGDEGLRGDLRVLDRLIEKEQAAHENIGDAASLLALHDPEAEAEHVAEGIGQHATPEEILPEPDAPGDFLQQLLGTAEPGQRALFEQVATAQSLTLFADDLEYAKEAFSQLAADERTDAAAEVEWHDHIQGLSFTPPADLQRRFAYLPPELTEAGDGELQLTTDRDRVCKALEASRQDPDRWPQWQLLWPQHPVVEWLNDRVLATFRRHEAPIIRVPAGLGPKESGFLFQGITSNRRSQPILVEWFVVVLSDGAERVMPLADLLQAGALDAEIPNSGQEVAAAALHERRARAVEVARAHMDKLRKERGDRLRGPLKAQQRRVSAWQRKALQQLDAKKAKWTAGGRKLRSDQERRLDAAAADIEGLVQARKAWIEDGLATIPDPYLRIAAAVIGRDYTEAN